MGKDLEGLLCEVGSRVDKEMLKCQAVSRRLSSPGLRGLLTECLDGQCLCAEKYGELANE